jgi:CRP/FNR family cyclic AMP-dependent transcriptional regulator
MEPGEAIVRAPIFQHLSRSSLESVAKSAKVQKFAPGDILVKEGADAVSFFVIVNGEAEAVKGLGGDGAVVLEKLKQLDFFGEMALLDGFPRSASVRAVTDCECIVLVRWDFLALIRTNPQVALDILPVLSRRLRDLDNKLMMP